MANWRVAESLKTLKAQLNTAFPNRSKASDGSIGDLAHASRKSDHNPNPAGVVTAIDITHDPRAGVNCHELAEQLVKSGDPRIKYLIWNSRIKLGRASWTAYRGTNRHDHHLHISVVTDPKLYDSRDEWKLSFSPTPVDNAELKGK